MIDYLSLIIGTLSFAMVLLALAITLVSRVPQMISIYRIQCVVLMLITGFSVLVTKKNPADLYLILSILLALTIPLGLALLIESMLVQATVPAEVNWWSRLVRLLDPFLKPDSFYHARQQARSVWLHSGNQYFEERFTKKNIWQLAIQLLLVILAFTISNHLVPQSAGSAASGIRASILSVTFSLLFLGLYTMTIKPDIISQVMGLLMMEQGMFLVPVRGIDTFQLPAYVICWIFIGLFLYIFITLTIMVYLLPILHQISGSIEIDNQQQLHG